MTVEKAKEWLRLNDLPDIAVKKRGTGKDIVFSHSVETGQGKIEEAIDFFEKNVSLLGPGRYVLLAKLGAKSGASQRVFDFDIPEDAAGIGGTGVNSIMNQESIGQIISDQVKSQVSAFRAEMEKEKLLERIKDLEQELKEKASWQPKLEFLSEKLIEGIMKLNNPFQNKIRPAADAGTNGGANGVSHNGTGNNGAASNNGVSGINQEEAEALDARANAAFDILVEKLGADLVPALEALAAKDPAALKNLLKLI